MKTNLAAAWRLAKPFWVSEQRWPARGLLALIIAIDLTRAWCILRMTYWNRDFLDAMVAYDLAAFWRQIWVFVAIASSGIFLDTARPWFAQKLEIRWRTWMTTAFVGRWLKSHAYLRLSREHGLDNPDQRIAEDLRLMTTSTLKLGLGLLDNMVRMVMYSTVVWSLSNTLVVSLGGSEFQIPGYLLWAALIYALVGSLLLEKFGNPMVTADYVQQQREAHFRYLLVRLRENAEQVAFYRGERAEHNRLTDAFAMLRLNWRDLMVYTKRVTFIDRTYTEVGAFVPYLIIVPRYFAKEITLGMMQQVQLTFARVRGTMSWFISYFKELALLRSAYRRLLELDRLLAAEPAEGGIDRTAVAGSTLRVSALKLALPNGQSLASVDDLTIAPGERWLVRGPSGLGKSTLLRALAGLWSHGAGRIEWPGEARTLFVPQKPYLPPGSLRACLCFPGQPTDFSPDDCRAALESVRLAHLVPLLEEEGPWSDTLSPGEQQRLAFARVLLQKPSHLFLDEATSSLDEALQAEMYQLLIQQLPGLTLVSVAHRESLSAFHDHVLQMQRAVVDDAVADASLAAQTRDRLRQARPQPHSPAPQADRPVSGLAPGSGSLAGGIAGPSREGLA